MRCAPPMGFGLKAPALIAPAWSPLALGVKLSAWYRADQLVTAAGGFATAWGDLSTNAQNLSSSGVNRPGYTPGPPGTARMDFSLSSAIAMAGGSFTLPIPAEIIAVVGANAPTSGTGGRIVDFTPGSVNTIMQYGGNIYQYSGGALAAGPAVPYTAADFVIDAICNDTSSSVSVNDASPVPTSPGSAAPSAAQLVVGNFAGSFAYAFDGWIDEVIVANAPLSGPEQTSLVAYLTATWGVG
jgi:hypothetical protein